MRQQDETIRQWFMRNMYNKEDETDDVSETIPLNSAL